jgi:hypothetical protein
MIARHTGNSSITEVPGEDELSSEYTSGERPRRPGRTRRILVTVAAVMAPIALLALVAYWISTLFVISAGVAELAVAAEPVLTENSRFDLRDHAVEPALYYRAVAQGLESYFSDRLDKEITVSYELLGDLSPNGMPYPYCYVWVTISNGAAVVEEGAVLLEADNAVYLGSVKYFVGVETIRQNPASIQGIFPEDVRVSIEQRLEEFDKDGTE